MPTVILSGLMLPAALAAPPNIVVILSDDAGFEEFGLYKVKKGVPSNTPNIDRLGEQGVAFAHCWGQAICGPSRSMFLTGNYAVHNGSSDNGTTSSAKSKGVEYGVHVPFVVAGAGVKRRGMVDELMDFTDVLPTIADFAGARIPARFHVDGVSLKPFLSGVSETTKPVIHSFPGPARLVRTKGFMLEAVCPLYDKPRGRFYKTNGSWDGRGYDNITHNPEFKVERERFEAMMNELPAMLPTSWDDPVWEHASMRKGYKHFNDPKRRETHLSLPKKYQFYDESF